jgi:CheY-like chemotaxis protein
MRKRFLVITQEEVERWHPDLVMLDLLVDAVQEQQVWQLIRQFKDSPQLASLPVFICAAALVLPGSLSYAQDQHIPILFKHFDKEQLSRAIHTLLTPAPG